MLNARSVYRRVAILHSLQSERPITIKIHVRNSSSSQCKILPRVPHAESSFPGLTLANAFVYVDAVVKIDVIRQIMNPSPSNWHARAQTFPHRLQDFGFGPDL